MAEHHFQPEGYECIPNLLMLNVHLAHLTKNIRLGCAFNIAPMWHPLRLAEDYATADILTGGRVVFGVGRGYHTREIETFGSPLLDQNANREMFEEQVEVILKSFNEASFSHHGQYYDIPPKVPYRGYELEEITLVPRPRNLPVECWQPIQGGTRRALDFMAKHGIKGMIGGGVAEGGAMDDTMREYQAAVARTGREIELGEDISVGFHFYLADTVEKAIQEGLRVLRRKRQDVRPAPAPPGPQRGADTGHQRSYESAFRRVAQLGGGGEERCGLVRPAGAHHRATQRRCRALPGHGAGGRQPPRRHSPIGNPGATGVVRQGSDAGVQGQRE